MRPTEVREQITSLETGPLSAHGIPSDLIGKVSGALAPARWWERYPRGLGAYVSEALDTGNANLAFSVATALSRCEAAERSLRIFQTRMAEVPDAAVQKILVESYSEDQRALGQCQTVVGDAEEIKLRLLQLAYDKSVVGAAAALVTLGKVDSKLSQALLRDAQAGHLVSMALVAGQDAGSFGSDPSTFASIQLALVILADSKETSYFSKGALALADQFATYHHASRNASQENIRNAAAAWAGESYVSSVRDQVRSPSDEVKRQAENLAALAAKQINGSN